MRTWALRRNNRARHHAATHQSCAGAVPKSFFSSLLVGNNSPREMSENHSAAFSDFLIKRLIVNHLDVEVAATLGFSHSFRILGLSLTPGRLPFVNSTPAASRARRMSAIASSETRRRCRSKSTTVERPRLAASARVG